MAWRGKKLLGGHWEGAVVALEWGRDTAESFRGSCGAGRVFRAVEE